MIVYAIYPPNPQRKYELKKTTAAVGRSSGTQVVDIDLTPDVLVSRQHARLTLENGEYWIEDLGSKYGTWVNGQSIASRTRLWPGDKVQVGQTKLEVQLETVPQEEAPGVVAGTVAASEAPSTLILPPEIEGVAGLETIRSRLTAFYELGAALGTLDAVEPLAQTVVEHLLNALPDAKRGAMLLGPELLLKAHLPAGKASVSTNLAKRALETRRAFIWRFSPPEVGGDLYASVLWSGTQSAMYAPLVWSDEVLGVVCVDNLLNNKAFNDDDLRLMVAMANQAAMFIKNQALQQELRNEENRRTNLLRQFSPKLAERLVKETGRLQLGGERANPVTILNADVRGFVALSAQMEPASLLNMLNEMFSTCVPIVFRYDGMVDKFGGDSILAVFGSPEPDEQQCQKAVRAACEMQAALVELHESWQRRGLTPFEVGIGVHTGPVLHGFIGSPERMEYTVIGDTVNRAARYCDGAGRGEILISKAVYERVYRWAEVTPRTVHSKHPETEPDFEAFLVREMKVEMRGEK